MTASDTTPGETVFFEGVLRVESVITALVSGLLTLAGVLASNSRSRAAMEVKIDELAKRVEKHNSLVERTYRIEQDLAVARNDIETLYRRSEER